MTSNTYDLPDVDYKNSITSIKVFTLDGIVNGSWIEKSEVMLDFSYDIKKEKFLQRSGIIGQIIEKSSMSEEEKTQRVIEAITNGLWSSQFE